MHGALGGCVYHHLSSLNSRNEGLNEGVIVYGNGAWATGKHRGVHFAAQSGGVAAAAPQARLEVRWQVLTPVHFPGLLT